MNKSATKSAAIATYSDQTLVEVVNILEKNKENLFDITDLRKSGLRADVVHQPGPKTKGGFTDLFISYKGNFINVTTVCISKDCYNKKIGRTLAVAKLLDSVCGGIRYEYLAASYAKKDKAEKETRRAVFLARKEENRLKFRANV